MIRIGDQREKNHYEKTPAVKNPHMKITLVVLVVSRRGRVFSSLWSVFLTFSSKRNRRAIGTAAGL